MLELQDVWSPSNPVIHYSTRRIAEALSVSNSSAARTLTELKEHGFIEQVEESHWLNGKARTYRLTWLANGPKEPTNDWMNWGPKTNPTSHPWDGHPAKRPTTGTVSKNAAIHQINNQ